MTIIQMEELIEEMGLQKVDIDIPQSNQNGEPIKLYAFAPISMGGFIHGAPIACCRCKKKRYKKTGCVWQTAIGVYPYEKYFHSPATSIHVCLPCAIHVKEALHDGLRSLAFELIEACRRDEEALVSKGDCNESS